MNKSKRIQQRIIFFLAASILAMVLIVVAFVLTVDTSVNAAYASDEPPPTLAVPPTYTISPTPD